jgi:Ca2+-binding RTX toxin-like protein
VTSATTDLTISGSGEDGATVTLFDDQDGDGAVDTGESLGTATVASGRFSLDIALAEGTHSVKAVQTDIAGNTSAASAALSITVDATAPGAPSGLDLAAGDDTGSSSTDNVTSATTGLTISGSGETGATVTLFDDRDNDGTVDAGESLGTATVASGRFSLDIALAVGTHMVKAVQTDAAGNASAASAALSIIVEPVASAATNDGDSGTPTTTIGGGISASLPAGISATSSSGAGDASAVSSTLSSAIAQSSLGSSDKEAADTALQSYIGALPPGTVVAISTVTLTGGDGSPQTITINGTSAAEAMVIDVSLLPQGTVLVLENIDFAVIIGAAHITGGAGSNYVIGDSGSQYIVLGPEDDTLMGGAGADTIGSAGGRDVLMGGDGNDVVFGGEDGDYLYGNAGTDAIYGNAGADLLHGGQGDDWMFGGQDGDYLCGNAGADAIYGNAGADLLHGGQGDDWMFGGQDNDTLCGDKGVDVLYGDKGADVLYGNAGDDWLLGGDGGDALFGGQGNDWLAGEAGDDWLAGDKGADTLTGGAGNDYFVYTGPDQGGDVITDFASGSDAIFVASAGFGSLAAGVLDSRLFALSGAETNDTRFVFNTATGVLSYDADGSDALASVVIATLTNGCSLSSSDIMVMAG